MRAQPPDFVDLDRRFVASGDSAADVEPEFLTGYLAGRLATWPQVLTSARLIVVLAEAGSGKTTELRALVRAEIAEARFFAPIEDLAELDLEDALSPAPRRAFQVWKQCPDRPATFLLDSVDEARLRHPSFFRRALQRLTRTLAEDLPRCHVLLTCRGSDWRGSEDIEQLLEVFGAAPTDGDPELPVLKVWRMAPLDAERMSRLARHEGIDDPAAFLKALELTGTVDLCNRPPDLRWAARRWLEGKPITSRREMLEDAVRHRLSEPSPDRRPMSLPPSRARAGAELLAAAITLGRLPAIRSPAAGEGDSKAALEPSQVLPDWPPAEVASLLRTALFDPITLGRVRFHQRAVSEYLTACWLRRLISDHGDPRPVIDILLPRSAVGPQFLAPALSATAAWLAMDVPEVRDALLAAAPYVLIQAGDPTALPVEVRHAALRRHAERNANRLRTLHGFDRHQLTRFVDPSMGAVIAELLQVVRMAEPLLVLLLRLVEIGRFRACAPACLSIALDTDAGVSTRQFAILALEQVGDEKQLVRLVEILNSEGAEPVRSAAAGALYPSHLSAVAFLDALLDGESDARTAGSRLSRFLRNLEPVGLDPQDRHDLLVALADRLAEPPLGTLHNKPFVTSGRSGLLDPAAHLLVLEFEDPHGVVLRRLPRTLLLAFGAAMGGHFRPEVASGFAFRRLTQLPQARREIFWSCIEQAEQDHGSAWRLKDLPWNRGPFCPSADDLTWLLQDTNGRPQLRHRLLALDGVLQCCSASGTEALNQQVTDAAVLRRLARRLNPMRSREAWYSNRWDRESKLREQRLGVREQGNRQVLAKRVELLGAGTDLHNLIFLYGEVQRAEGGGSRWAKATWRCLTTSYGEEVARAFRDGCIALARTEEIPFPTPETRGKIPWICVLGLCGLDILAVEGALRDRLSLQEAGSAVRLALWELNELPAWLDDLLPDYEDIVGRMLGHAYETDYNEAVGEVVSWTVAHRVLRASPALRRLLAPRVRDLVAAGEPADPRTLEHALGLLLAAEPHTRSVVANQAPERTSGAQNTAFRWWWACWMVENPSAGLDHLRSRLTSSPEENELLVADLLEDPSWWLDKLPIPAMEQLAVLLLDVIDPDRDERRPTDRPYAPGWRDDLCRFRDALPERLSKKKDRLAYEALLRLAERPGITAHRVEWLRDLATKQAAGSGQGEAWPPERMLEFVRRMEAPPRSGQELFDLALLRLERIDRQLQAGDFSQRGLFLKETLELEYQRWLASRLEEAAAFRYEVVREPEVDRGKKPDIQLMAAGVRERIAIELKRAHRCTLRELDEALRVQLVGQYLRGDRWRHGILVLCNAQPGRIWKGDGKQRLRFDDVVAVLQRQAAALNHVTPATDGLEVFGLDFTDPDRR